MQRDGVVRVKPADRGDVPPRPSNRGGMQLTYAGETFTTNSGFSSISLFPIRDEVADQPG